MRRQISLFVIHRVFGHNHDDPIQVHQSCEKPICFAFFNFQPIRRPYYLYHVITVVYILVGTARVPASILPFSSSHPPLSFFLFILSLYVCNMIISPSISVYPLLYLPLVLPLSEAVLPGGGGRGAQCPPHFFRYPKSAPFYIGKVPLLFCKKCPFYIGKMPLLL